MSHSLVFFFRSLLFVKKRNSEAKIKRKYQFFINNLVVINSIIEE